MSGVVCGPPSEPIGRSRGDGSDDCDALPDATAAGEPSGGVAVAGATAGVGGALERRLGLAGGRLRPSSDPADRFFALLGEIGRPPPMSLGEARRAAGHYRLLRASLPARPEHVLALAEALCTANARSRADG